MSGSSSLLGGSGLGGLGVRAAPAALPPSITYGSSDVTWYDGVAITPLTPTNTGGPVTTYSVDPAFPTGVSINSSTGEISGKPSGVSALTPHTITATGPGGSGTFEMTTEVVTP